jgi:hypothetical protein
MREFRVEAVTTRCEDILDTAEEMPSRSESDPGFSTKAISSEGSKTKQRAVNSRATRMLIVTQRNSRHFRAVETCRGRRRLLIINFDDLNPGRRPKAPGSFVGVLVESKPSEIYVEAPALYTVQRITLRDS